jgi:hypothetical protein
MSSKSKKGKTQAKAKPKPKPKPKKKTKKQESEEEEELEEQGEADPSPLFGADFPVEFVTNEKYSELHSVLSDQNLWVLQEVRKAGDCGPDVFVKALHKSHPDLTVAKVRDILIQELDLGSMGPTEPGKPPKPNWTAKRVSILVDQRGIPNYSREAEKRYEEARRHHEKFTEFEVPRAGLLRKAFNAKSQGDVEALIRSRDYYLGDDEMRLVADKLGVGLVVLTEPDAVVVNTMGNFYVMCFSSSPIKELRDKNKPVVLTWLWKSHYRVLVPYDTLLAGRDLKLKFSELPKGVVEQLQRCAEFSTDPTPPVDEDLERAIRESLNEQNLRDLEHEAEIQAGAGAAEERASFRYLDSLSDSDLFDFGSAEGEHPDNCEPLKVIKPYDEIWALDIVVGPGDWQDPKQTPQRLIARLKIEVGWKFAADYRLKKDGDAFVVTKACFRGDALQHGPALVFALKMFQLRHDFLFESGKPSLLQMPLWRFHADLTRSAGLELLSLTSEGDVLGVPASLNVAFGKQAREAGLVVGYFPVHGQETAKRDVREVIKDFGLVWSRNLKDRPMGL